MQLKDLSNLDQHIFDSCKKELCEYAAQEAQVIFVDDGTIFSQFYSKALEEGGVRFLVVAPEALEKMENRSATLILPLFKFRVFNLNFDNRAGLEYSPPYWVHIASDRLEHLRTFLLQRFHRVLLHPLTELEGVFKSYLFCQSFLNWISADSCPESHNDRLDRVLVKELLMTKGIHIENMYISDATLKNGSLDEFLFNLLKIEPQKFHRHMPLHRLYQKKWNRNIEINLLEREIYGNVD